MLLGGPAHEIRGVAHGCRKKQEPGMFGQEREGQLPDDASIVVVEEVKFVHHHTGELVDAFLAGDQVIEQDLRHHDPDAGVWIDPSIAGNEADGLPGKSPVFRPTLELAEFLIGEGNKRRGIVEILPRLQRLEDRRFCDQRFAHPRRGGHEHAACRFEPCQQCLFLKRIEVES